MSCRFAIDRRGTVALMVALVAPVLIGFGALIIDVGYWYGTKAILQNAADAAAISAARTLPYAASQNQGFLQAVADDQVARVIGTLPTPGVSVIRSGTGVGQSVTVTVSGTKARFLSGIFGTVSGGIVARATASISSTTQACVLALGTAASDGITISDTASTMSSPTCALYSSSDVVNKGAVLTPAVSAVGTISGSFPTTTGLISGALSQPNPYADVSIPTTPVPCATSSGCPGSVPSQANVTLQPGTYAGGLSLGSNSTVFFEPGVYYIQGGDLNFGGSLQVSGSGVTFVFIPDSAGKVGTIDWTGTGSSVSLSGPSAGTYDGILFYQAAPPNLGSNGCNCAYITGNSSYNLSGGIDLQASTGIVFTGNSTSGPTVTTSAGIGVDIAAQYVTVSGHATVNTGNPLATDTMVGGDPYLSD